MNIAIISDEAKFRTCLNLFLLDNFSKEDSHLRIDEFGSVELYLESNKPYDFLFQDIELKKSEGFDLEGKEKLGNEFHQLKGIMTKCLRRKYDNLEFVINNKKLTIRCADILYFEERGNYLMIHMVNKKVVKCRHTLKSLMEEIENRKLIEFVKLNKSLVINKDACKYVEIDYAIMNDGTELPLIIPKRKELRSELTGKIIESKCDYDQTEVINIVHITLKLKNGSRPVWFLIV